MNGRDKAGSIRCKRQEVSIKLVFICKLVADSEESSVHWLMNFRRCKRKRSRVNVDKSKGYGGALAVQINI